MSNTTNTTAPATKNPQVSKRVLLPLLGFALATGPALGSIGLALSFLTVAHLAKALGMPGDSHLYPIAIDVGILAALATDILFVYLNRPLWFLRPVAWALTAFTVWANFHGGTTGSGMDMEALARMGLSASTAHQVQAGLHIVMPSLWVVLLEALRAGLLHDRRRATGTTGQTVPMVRWFLSPVRTALLYRRMRLWGIDSYPLALAMEAARLHGIDIVRAKQPGGRFTGPWRRLTWRWQIPRLLRAGLTSGNMPDEVAAEIARVVAAGQRTGWRRAVRWWVVGELEAAQDSPDGDVDSPSEDPAGAAPGASEGVPEGASAPGSGTTFLTGPQGLGWGVPAPRAGGVPAPGSGGVPAPPSQGVPAPGSGGVPAPPRQGVPAGGSKGGSGTTRRGGAKRTAKAPTAARISVAGLSDAEIVREYLDEIHDAYVKANPDETEVSPTHLSRHRLKVNVGRAKRILELYYSARDNADTESPDGDAKILQPAGRG